MGLNIQNSTIDGCPVASGYLRIDRISGSKREGATCTVGIYGSYDGAQEFGAYPFLLLAVALPWPEEAVRIEQALYPDIIDWLCARHEIGTITNAP